MSGAAWILYEASKLLDLYLDTRIIGAGNVTLWIYVSPSDSAQQSFQRHLITHAGIISPNDHSNLVLEGFEMHRLCNS
jgi:hypothetical protein